MLHRDADRGSPITSFLIEQAPATLPSTGESWGITPGRFKSPCSCPKKTLCWPGKVGAPQLAAHPPTWLESNGGDGFVL